MNDIDTFIRTDYSVMRIVKYNDLRFTETLKIIYCYYKGFYQSTNKPVYVSSVKLAELMGYDNTVTIQSSIKKLEKMRLLECVEAKAGTTRQFITHSINESLCTYPNSKKLVKGTNQDPERPVKARTQKPVVKEEIKQNPMPSAEPVLPSVDASEVSAFEDIEPVTVPHVDDSTFEEDMAATESLVKPERVSCGVREISMEDFIDGNVPLSYDDFLKHYAKIGLDKNMLTDKARELYSEHIRKESEDIPF